MLSNRLKWLPVWVGALGYFVDIYDLFIFTVVRQPSLRSLGVPEAELLSTGISLLNYQTAGLLIGGVFWGWLADRRGRTRVLFGSIVVYSLANVLSAYPPSVSAYAVIRFIAGFGLAGELGVAVTLVAETLSKEVRGYGTMLVASIGFMGAVAAALANKYLSWQAAYLLGGGLGFLLLLVRFQLKDSPLFEKIRRSAGRGDLRLLFTRERLGRYLLCILAGLPIYFTAGVLTPFSPEIGKALGIYFTVDVGTYVIWSYLGVAVGDLLCGTMSQKLRSRKKAVFVFVGLLASLVIALLLQKNPSLFEMYTFAFALGIGGGYWAVLITLAAEQFGTNLRATVATSVPNFIRATTIPMTLLFKTLIASQGIVHSALYVGSATIALGILATGLLQETFHRDLDFTEA